MRVEVDQSGRIDQTDRHTALAFADVRGAGFAVLLPRGVKQQCLRELRNRGIPPNTLYLRMFVVGLYFLLHSHIETIDLAVIDIEYPGHEVTIRRYLLNLLRRSGRTVPKDKLDFAFIGKRSTAHYLAWATFKGRRPPDRVLTVENILGEF